MDLNDIDGRCSLVAGVVCLLLAVSMVMYMWDVMVVLVRGVFKVEETPALRASTRRATCRGSSTKRTPRIHGYRNKEVQAALDRVRRTGPKRNDRICDIYI